MTRPTLAARIGTVPAALPVAFDPDVAADTLSRLDPGLRTGAMAELLYGTAGSSPYLAGLILRHADWLATAEEAPEATMTRLLADLRAEAAGAADERALGRMLRRTKSRAALLIALADLGGAWDLGPVTAALSDLAETALQVAVDWLLAEGHRRGRLPPPGESGYVVLAMGKLGARELNYSSDIDLICLFDQDRYAPDDEPEAKAALIRLTRALVRLLADQTDEGYVFRTDLRLRPSPSSTPVCQAMAAAERYYEAMGRTWERAAHIKARPVAGDIPAGRAYLARLAPFVWRRHLDFAAIEDINDLLAKIRRQQGKFTPEGLAGHDLKRGPGGIREIEFLAQTQQLIRGGRDPALRGAGTLGVLDALAGAGVMGAGTAASLKADYTAHRTLEHRLQMVADAQTQTVPQAAEARARVAALAGWADPAPWARDLSARLARIHATVEGFFAPDHVPQAPDTSDAALEAAGFARPEAARALLERWSSGAIPATRSGRARGLYARLAPQILTKLARGASPDEAILQFDRFLSGLPAGVQVFSLFRANPPLLDLVVEVCAVAPRLAQLFGQAPRTLDALLDPDFFEPLPGVETLTAELAALLARAQDYERVLDAARAWAREGRFRVGVQVLRGLAGSAEAGRAHAGLAEACLRALLPHVEAEFARRHGAPPGGGMAVLALGKLGSLEMTGGSDLDLITVYDAPAEALSDGRRPLAAAQYYPKLTQALVAALTAPTAEGRLYEVDMRLRPSGRQGPVATSLEAFARYQREAAWVWEHMALTRARVVAGAPGVGEAVAGIAAEALAGRRGAPDVATAARAMRTRLTEAHARERHVPWAFKHTAGGIMEIEFLAQTGVLIAGLDTPVPAGEALGRLAAIGWLEADEAARLAQALALQQALQQVERVALEGPFDPEGAGQGLCQAMARAGGAADLPALEARLLTLQRAAAAIVERRFAALCAPP